MRKLRIRIGGDALKDMTKVMKDPSKGEPGTHTIYLKRPEELSELLSPKKLEMLRFILNYPDKPRTVTEVSKKTKRKQESISRDAAILEKHSLIEKIRKGRTALLKAKYDTLEIKLAE